MERRGSHRPAPARWERRLRSRGVRWRQAGREVALRANGRVRWRAGRAQSKPPPARPLTVPSIRLTPPASDDQPKARKRVAVASRGRERGGEREYGCGIPRHTPPLPPLNPFPPRARRGGGLFAARGETLAAVDLVQGDFDPGAQAPDFGGGMADDGAADKDQELQQLEDRLRVVGERLHTPPDNAEDLLKLLSVSLLLLTQRLFLAIYVSVSLRVRSAAIFFFFFVLLHRAGIRCLGVASVESRVLVLFYNDRVGSEWNATWPGCYMSGLILFQMLRIPSTLVFVYFLF
jgi:hypothetical protein